MSYQKKSKNKKIEVTSPSPVILKEDGTVTQTAHKVAADRIPIIFIKKFFAADSTVYQKGTKAEFDKATADYFVSNGIGVIEY